jgi:hypothetical protein
VTEASNTRTGGESSDISGDVGIRSRDAHRLEPAGRAFLSSDARA